MFQSNIIIDDVVNCYEYLTEIIDTTNCKNHYLEAPKNGD